MRFTNEAKAFAIAPYRRLLILRQEKRGTIMLDCGERFVKMMQKTSPPLVFRRLSEAYRVIFETPPLDKQNVAIWNFKTLAQFMRNMAGHRSDNWGRIAEGGFEFTAC